MIKHASLLLLLAATALMACGDVEHCVEETELGCLNAVPIDGTRCLFDLVPIGGLCQKPGGGPCGNCGEGALCDTSTSQCINFCQAPDVLPGSVPAPEVIFCEAVATQQNPTPAMLTFADVCQRRCRLRCQRLSQFCPGYQCPAGSCDGPDVQDACTQECGADLACITRGCNDTRFALCDSSLSCPNGAVPNCAAIKCSNDCTFDDQGVAGDGFCDDGDVLSSDYAQCAWGTDCADCGPRTGVEVIGGYGAICQYNLNCQGGTGSPDTSGAWCVSLMSMPGVNRCMPDCSRGQACPSGFACREALFAQGEDGTLSQITAGGYSSYACVPEFCR